MNVMHSDSMFYPPIMHATSPKICKYPRHRNNKKLFQLETDPTITYIYAKRMTKLYSQIIQNDKSDSLKQDKCGLTVNLGRDLCNDLCLDISDD